METMTTCCRSCRESLGAPFLDLGATPIANDLISSDALDTGEAVVPLAVAHCSRCGLVQTTVDIDPEDTFREYVYRSSYSDIMLAHVESLVRDVIARRQLDGDSFVVEVASNDGYLLRHYRAAGVPVLGIDPAANIAVLAEAENDVQTLVEFFNLSVAKRLSANGERADVIHALNVLAHVPDPNELMAGFAELMKPGGEVIVEVPYVWDLIENAAFDTIYHEHFSYFSLLSLDYLARKNRLVVADVEHIATHGGSLRANLVHEGGAQTDAVRQRLDEESAQGLDGAAFYESFAGEVERLRLDLRELLFQLKADGKAIAAYGAAAKGSTLLNVSRIGRGVVDFVVDRSPLKQGLHLPGVHIPIVRPEELLARSPDYVLMLAWNLVDEILEQQTVFRKRGGQFVIPLPTLRIV
jgi:SAM-dependent methyltransferase